MKKSIREIAEDCRREKRESISAVLRDAGDNGAVEMVSIIRKSVRLLITKHAVYQEKWRITRLDECGPYGHEVFENRETAIRAAGGDSFSEHIKGPSYYRVGEFKVSRVMNRGK